MTDTDITAMCTRAMVALDTLATGAADVTQELTIVNDTLTALMSRLVTVLERAQAGQSSETAPLPAPSSDLPKVNGRSPRADAIYLALVDKACQDFGHRIASKLVNSSSCHLTYWATSAQETFYKWLAAVPYHAANEAKITTVQHALQQALRAGLVRTVIDYSFEVSCRAIEHAVAHLPKWDVLMAQAIGQVVMETDPTAPARVD